jgi:histidine triad (HIT) family protein
MYNHAPNEYVCPICVGISPNQSGETLIHPNDIVYQDEIITAFIGSYFIGHNNGHVIVVPNQHYENLYDMPEDVGAQIFKTAKKMALALKKAYHCDGITTQQNNEPDGGQHAFHYHLHVFPRYKNDDIFAHMTTKRLTSPEERKPFADKVKAAL